MKKSEFKKIIKPLVAECIKESLLEDGLISGIIAEVVKGMSQQPLVETSPPEPAPDPAVERMKANAFSETSRRPKLQEQKKKLMAAIGNSSYNGVDLFEGTTPAQAEASPKQAARPMAGQAPNDPGVDITNLFGAVGRKWNAHMNEVKTGK